MKCAATPAQIDGNAYKSDDSSRTLHDILVDETSPKPDEVLDREKLMSAVRGVLSELTPREETVLRLRFGITETFDDTEVNNVNA